ncbi:sugar phosphate isomerase/epimerase family protein [Pedobacter heparinus]|uniref:Xylose isomerase domain protein TIM barrel n=1 Tax=Pedobacter heparinus (strain ATCC 13125 / DSM 2366 / CIP 104194 / JCM 7457 / NBRC 12017 / NCIMB 9290 / NRRL B-14731 / HIM 762-3) TaxID=485917 RepID=C6XU04_PEDHD|nr:TIM barrel protein [Pedobacter heparinus]ACU03790.1 Xylose isomerase domain protein TIM barrel [Pedobacter heparinus DSM 2366]
MVNVNFLYPRWGAEHVDWNEFLAEVKEQGYYGIEWYPYGEGDANYETVIAQLKDAGLKYAIVMTVKDEPESEADYFQRLEKQLSELALLGQQSLPPLFISAQTGREYFSLDEVYRCLSICDKVQSETGIKIYQETHRNKWAYGLHKIPEVLKKYPDLRFTLDISHWFCVSESYLEDQRDKLLNILPHVEHIHSRVGYTQGAQIPDVTNPLYKDIVDIHLEIWQQWVDLKKINGVENITISTEFGPPPYLITTGHTDTDYLKQWEQNLWIKKYLIQLLNLT